MLYNIKAALFALDSIFVFPDRLHFLAWKKLSDENAWAFDNSLNSRLGGLSRIASLDVILSHNQLNLSDNDREKLADQKNRYFVDYFNKLEIKELQPGVIDFIRRLKKRGILTGLCSVSRNTRMVLEQSQTVPFFDCVVSGEDIQHSLTRSHPFLMAARRLRCHPFNCVAFEVSQTGIDAVRCAGFRHVGIGSADLLPNADETVSNYDKIDVDCLVEFGRVHPPEVDPWKIIQSGKTPPCQIGYWESLFSLTNGLIGIRGSYEEKSESLKAWEHPGSYINGVYETVALPKPDHELIDDLKKKDVLVNLFDWRLLTVRIDGHKFSFDCGTVIKHRRELDMQNGVLRRFIVWESPEGKQVEIEIVRLVSMHRLHSGVIRYVVRPLNFSGQMEIVSSVEANVRPPQLKNGGPRRRSIQLLDGNVLIAHYQMEFSKLHVVLGCSHAVKNGLTEDYTTSIQQIDDRVEFVFRFDGRQGEQIRIDKHVCLYSSLEVDEPAIAESAYQTVIRDQTDGLDLLLNEQAEFWRSVWKTSDIEIDACPADQQAIRFELFQLRQNHTVENKRSISATGLTGDNYCGWIFWDTEIFMFPYFIYNDPVGAKALLEFRCNTLAGARRRASEIQLPGACYGWSTLDGTENNVGFNASTAQYHINCDIGYAFWHYYNVTLDFEFISDRGLEVLAEICRMFSALGKYVPMRGNKFCINYVTGPDEYNYHVNNNCFTNMMVQKHFEFFFEMFDRLWKEDHEKASAFCEKLALTDKEISKWRKIAGDMYIPFNEELRIHEQDDGYLYRDPVDMDSLPDNFEFKYNFTELNLGRMQVSKQADVVLASFLLGDRFTPETKQKNFDFYIQRTKHVSSLSACIHSIMAAETGRNELVYDLLRQTLYMDLCDLKKNTNSGIHFACAGGAWMVVVNGLAGMRVGEGGLSFNPCLPEKWNGYRFKAQYRGRLLEVDVTKVSVRYTLLKGEPLAVRSLGASLVLVSNKPVDQKFPEDCLSRGMIAAGK